MSSRDPRKRRRGKSKPFLLLPMDMIRSDQYATLSARAVKLMIDIGAQYNGTNNSDLDIVWARMSKRGWTSKDQLNKARDELVERGFIVRTCLPGWRGTRSPTLYAITWQPIDDTRNAIEVSSTKVPPHTWKSACAEATPKSRRKVHPKTNPVPRTEGHIDPYGGSMEVENGTHRPVRRVDTAPFSESIDPYGGSLLRYMPEAGTSDEATDTGSSTE